MSRYVAFLRGVNLGTKRRVKGDRLRQVFEGLGCGDVATFRASGNVIFAAEGKKPVDLSERLEAGLGESLGYGVPVYLRSVEEVRSIAAAKPFAAKQIAASAGKLQVVLLREAPPASARKKAMALSTDEDRIAVDGRELYWLPRGGMSESDLDLDAIAATLGPVTIRTMGTIEQIAAKHFAD